MKLKLLVLGLVSAASLALAGPAFAIQTMLVTPTVFATGATGEFTVGIAQDDADAPIAKLTIYAPVGYSLKLSTSFGTKIGTAQGTVILKALAGAKAPVAGDIINDDPAKYAANSSNLQCTGQAAHNAVWLLNLTLAGQTLPVPVYVDNVAAGTAEAAFASVKIQVCFSSPDIPASAGGAANGAQPVAASMTLTDTFTNPGTAGTFAWRTLFTPYQPGTATVNAAATVEGRSIVQLPTQLSLSGKRSKKKVGKKVQTFVKLSGAFTQVNVGVAGQAVTILANGKAVKTLTTGANGAFSVTIRITKKTAFTAQAEVASKRDDTAGCAGPSLVPAGCKTATTAPAKVKSSKSFTAVPFKK